MSKPGRNKVKRLKHIPNILSCVRIVLSLSLFLLPPLGREFFVVYALCGITDIADGIIARACNAVTKLGGKLDSLGDFVMAVTAAVIIVPIVNPSFGVWAWIEAIAIVRIGSPIVAYMRHREFGMVHTVGNKITGLLLFLYPFTLTFGSSAAVLTALCVVASVSAIEELAIQCTSKRYCGNRASIFAKEPSS